MATEAMEADLPFLSVHKDGVLVECMCLHGVESIVLGRHTNCDLMVTHPSVSRHHLEIQVLHGSRELLLTDLDSIHGTWINGEQALPLVPVTAKEGDFVKLGASSRSYSIQWRPRPPQNITSSEEYSDNSNSLLDCSSFKEKGPAGSTTTIMESSKTCQVDAGNKLQPTCSTNCNDVHAVEEHKVEQESEITANSLHKEKDAPISEELSQDFEVITATDALPEDAFASTGRDLGGGNRENSKDTASIRAINPQIDLQSPKEKDDLGIQETGIKRQEEKRINHSVPNFHEGRGDDDSQPEKFSEEANPTLSKLWVRRSRSNPPPNLLTSTNSACSSVALPSQEKRKNCPLPSAPPIPLSYLMNNLLPSAPPLLSPGKLTMVDEDRTNVGNCISDEFASDDAKENQERAGNVDQMMKHADVSDDYISDKENNSPGLRLSYKQSKPIKKTYNEGINQERSHFATTEGSRRPFQPLALTADGGCRPSYPAYSKEMTGEENSVTQLTKRSSPVVQSLDLMLRKLKGTARSEPRRVWHIVVDSSCFLDSNSFKSLRQLEGIREVRLIIPKIVISELDYRRGMGRSQRKALNWIESCMVKLPLWIHVQSSSEYLPVAATPPVSPLSAPSIYGENMVSPTSGDHVLNCALLFNSTVYSGQVALLTNDIALKIKAMAEGLVCEAPFTFCESVLSPYSGRFLWTTSIAHGHGWTEKPCHIKSCSALAPSVLSGDQSTKEAVMSTVKAMAYRKNHAVESLKKQCYKQARGLKVALPH